MNNNKIIGYDPMTGQPIYENQNQTNNFNQQVEQKNTQVMSQKMDALKPKKEKKNQSKLITILIITNVLTAILSIVFIVAFILKDDNNKTVEKIEEDVGYTSTATTDPVSNDWTKYQFSIKGKTLSLPCLYKEFRDISGFSMKSFNEKSYLERNSSTNVNLYIGDKDNQKLALYVDIKNNTKEDLQYREAELGRISQTKYQVETNNADLITFPGNLKIGMESTKEKIIELFGEPSKIRDNSNEPYGNITLTYNMDTTYTTINYYEIKISDGKIEELTLDHKKNDK